MQMRTNLTHLDLRLLQQGTAEADLAERQRFHARWAIICKYDVDGDALRSCAGALGVHCDDATRDANRLFWPASQSVLLAGEVADFTAPHGAPVSRTALIYARYRFTLCGLIPPGDVAFSCRGDVAVARLRAWIGNTAPVGPCCVFVPTRRVLHFFTLARDDGLLTCTDVPITLDENLNTFLQYVGYYTNRMRIENDRRNVWLASAGESPAPWLGNPQFMPRE